MNIHLLHDTAGASHTVELLAHGLLVDGKDVSITSCAQEEIRLSSPTGEIHCTTEQLWRCLVGADPTVAEAGSLLAQCLAHWTALQRITQVLQRVEVSVPSLTLPSYRPSPFVVQLLSTLDGTQEQAEAVARVLRVPLAAVLAWASQQQHCLPAGVTPERLVEAIKEAPQSPLVPAPKARASEPLPAAGVERNGHEKQFRWSRLRTEQLTAFLSTISAQDLDGRSAAAAGHFGWPVAAIRARLESLQAEEPETSDAAPTRRSRPRERADASSAEDE